MIEQRVTLRYDAQQIPAIVQAVQGDTGRDVIFELADYEIPAGATANYYIDKPDGNAVYNSAEVISSTEILAHLTGQALAVPGRNNGQVRILSDGEVITSFDFVLEVVAFRGILHMQSETEVNIFDTAIQAAVDDAIEEIQAQTPVVTGMQNSIAPTYSSSSTYAIGDYVMYNAQLYKCNTAITTAEAWTAAHWTQVPLANDVSDLKSAIADTDDDLYLVDSEVTPRTENTYTEWRLNADGYRIADSVWNILEFRVFAGDVLKIVSDDRFQFQSSYVINASGATNKIGNTYGAGIWYLTVPSNALYLCVSTPIASTNVHIYKCTKRILDVETRLSGAETQIGNLQSADIALDNKIDGVNEDLELVTGVPKVIYTIGHFISTTNPLAMEDGVPVINGTSGAWKCAALPCIAGDVFTISGTSNNSNLRAWYFVNSNGEYISESANPFDETNLVITAPANAAWLILNSNTLTSESFIGKFIPDQLQDIRESLQEGIYNDSLIMNQNGFPGRVNPIEITKKTYASLQINDNNTVTVSTVRKSAICRIVPNAYISIRKIQTRFSVIAFTTNYPVHGITVNSRYQWNGVVNTDIGAQAGENDNYMIFMYHDSNDTPTAEQVEESMHIYYDCEDYAQFDMIAHADDHLINLLKYRPVGKVKKPYIAISCDDGNEVLATYTIPRIQYWKETYGVDIPVTFALMDNSEVMLDDTYKQLVIDACENYGSAIAVHGAQSYLLYTSRKRLMKYIAKNDKFLYDETGVKPSAIIYPEHQYNDLIQTICGSYYNVCGCGGMKHNYVYPDTSGRYFYIGEKSNCYEIYRLAIHDTSITSLSDVEDIVDFAYDNNYIICPYFHDVDLGNEAPNKDYLRSVLDKFVSYGISKGIDFIKLGDIPYVL